MTAQLPGRFVIFYRPKLKASLELAQEMAARLQTGRGLPGSEGRRLLPPAGRTAGAC